MNTVSVRGSAKIYEFPVRRRAMQGDAKAGQPEAAAMTAGAFGGSWYHEAALREVEPARKR